MVVTTARLDQTRGRQHPARPWSGRALRVVLAAVLVPVVALTSTVQPAAAADLRGPAISTEWQVPGNWRPADDGSCGYTAQWRVSDSGTPYVDGKLNCDTDWNITYERVEVHHSGSDATGQSCETTLPFNNPEQDSPPDSSFASITSADGDETTCELTNICWDVYNGEATANSTGLWQSGCDDMLLGALGKQELNTTCTEGYADRPVLDGETWVQPWTLGRSFRMRDVRFGTSAQAGWVAYVVLAPYTGDIAYNTRKQDAAAGGTSAQSQSIPSAALVPQLLNVKYPLGANWSQYDASSSVTGRAEGSVPPPPTREIIGAGYYEVNKQALGSLTKDEAWRHVPQDGWEGSKGVLGVTDAGRCAFYWGEKLALTPSDDFDEPVGDLATPPGPNDPIGDPPPPPPAPTEDGCEGFSFTDPSSWAGAGICVLVKLMQAVLRALGDVLNALLDALGLLADIVGAILGLVGKIGEMLLDFLIPSPGSWDFGGLFDQLETKPPFSIFDNLASGLSDGFGGYSNSGSCGALFEVGGKTLTCSSVKNAPGLSVLYTLVQVGLWVIGGIAVWNMASNSIRER